MERRGFISKCALLGISCMGFPLLIESCSGIHYVQGIAANNRIQIGKTHFVVLKKNRELFRKYIIVRSENHNYPIVLYRFAENKFSALLLRCTHQNSELNVNGDILTCPAHGSEFNNTGNVIQGPAEEKLQSFKVSTDEKNIYIQLV